MLKASHRSSNIDPTNAKAIITVLLDLPVEQGLSRKKLKDRFEREEIAFHQRVRQGYLEMAAKEPERWLVVNASQPKAKVTEIIWERVKQLLP